MEETEEQTMPREWYQRKVGKWRKTETDFKTPTQGYIDWQYALTQYLISQGTNGIRQGLLTTRFGNWADGATIRHELDCLRAQGKVEMFKVPNHRGQIVTFWRATDKIMEDDQ